MTSSLGRMFVTLFVVAVIAGNVTGDIAPLAILACVAFTLLCVSRGLRR
jgi:hypothetical protein